MLVFSIDTIRDFAVKVVPSLGFLIFILKLIGGDVWEGISLPTHAKTLISHCGEVSFLDLKIPPVAASPILDSPCLRKYRPSRWLLNQRVVDVCCRRPDAHLRQHTAAKKAETFKQHSQKP